jgi:secondary thiamine-phosphate synthase enzyme
MSASRTIVEHGSAAVIVATTGPGFYRLGGQIARRLSEMGAANGVATVFSMHTSASLCVQENADPTVLADLADTLNRLAPEDAFYRHDTEGPDDMPAHIKTLLTATSISLPVRRGRLALGVWQEVFLIEHREGGHERRIEVDFVGGFTS